MKNISSRFPGNKTYWLPNGADLDYFKNEKDDGWRKQNGFSENDFLLLYAGIIGHAQGLEIILNAAEQLKEHAAMKWLIVGNGPKKESLLKMKNEKGLSNVFFYDVLPKEKIPSLISSSDAAVIPLKKLDLFKGAIPSKIFENSAMGKPLLLGVEGEAKDLFIDTAKAGLFFMPEDEKDLARQALILYNNRGLCRELGENGCRYVKENFSRDQIAENFNNILLSV